MSTQEKDLPLLDQDSTAKLTDFARACKAAARAVSLYPSTHPAIRLSLAQAGRRGVAHYVTRARSSWASFQTTC